MSWAAFMNPKTAATAHVEKWLSGTSVKLNDLTSTGISFEVSLYT